jgi:hypothetical protein
LIYLGHGVRIRNGSFLLKGDPAMYDRTTILHLVNDAQRHDPYCACGAHMVPVDRDGGLWLECATIRDRGDEPASPIRALLDRVFHDRRVIVGREELLAA